MALTGHGAVSVVLTVFPSELMPQRYPPSSYKPLIRCKGQLAAGVVTSNGGILYEIHQVGGCARFKARIKTSGNGGTIDAFFVGPDVDIDVVVKNAPAFGSIVGTIYSTGGPAQVAVVAGTESQIFADCYGEGYVILKFTGTVGAGAITYCDVGRV